jgi:hypothetical protein
MDPKQPLPQALSLQSMTTSIATTRHHRRSRSSRNNLHQRVHCKLSPEELQRLLIDTIDQALEISSRDIDG